MTEAIDSTNERRLREYVGPFTDIGTSLGVVADDRARRRYRVSGSRRGSPFDLLIEASEDGLDMVVIRERRRREGRTPLSAVLAGGVFAHLDALARIQIRELRRRLGDPTTVIESHVQGVPESGVECEVPGERQTAAECLRQNLAVRHRPQGTRLVFLQGDAGAGKSWALMAAALSQAQAFLERRTPCLYLYVDAQGVNLRSLEQQLAHQLDVYGGHLRYPEVAPLARLGVLGLIIDGFDELIMPSGYNDTLGALCAYLEGFKGEGALVASARTTFFRVYDLSRAGVRLTQPLRPLMLRMAPWAEAERRAFCELHDLTGIQDRLEEAAAAVGPLGALLGRPYVVSQAAQLLAAGREIADLWDEVESAFIRRELTEKLADPVFDQPLLSEPQFRELMAEVAAEMWYQRSASLTARQVSEIADMCADEWGLAGERREVLSAKLAITPLLEEFSADGAQGRVRFPHEIMFARFVCRGLLRSLSSERGSDAMYLLGRAPLTSTILDQFCDVAARPIEGGDGVAQLLVHLASLFSTAPRVDEAQTTAAANIGLLVVELLRRREGGAAAAAVTGCRFDRIAFRGANIQGITFRRCVFGDVDARGAAWLSTTFEACEYIDRLELDRGQEFPTSVPPINWLVVRDSDGTIQEWFGADDARMQLFPAEAPQPQDEDGLGPDLSDRAEALHDLAERLARRALRVFWTTVEATDSDDAGQRSMKQNDLWDVLLDMLERNGLLERSFIQRRGIQGDVVRVEHPERILAALSRVNRSTPPAVARFVRELDAS